MKIIKRVLPIKHVVPSLKEANAILVKEYGWSPNCILIRDFAGEWSNFKKNWEMGGKKYAYTKFIQMRDSVHRIEVARFKSRTSAFSDAGASAYADNWN